MFLWTLSSFVLYRPNQLKITTKRTSVPSMHYFLSPCLQHLFLFLFFYSFIAWSFTDLQRCVAIILTIYEDMSTLGPNYCKTCPSHLIIKALFKDSHLNVSLSLYNHSNTPDSHNVTHQQSVMPQGQYHLLSILCPLTTGFAVTTNTDLPSSLSKWLCANRLRLCQELPCHAAAVRC